MARVSILLCLVLLVTLGVVISVSFADNNEVKLQHLESSKKEKNVDHKNKQKDKGGNVDKSDEKFEQDVRKKDDQQADDEKKHVDKEDKKYEKDVRKKDDQQADDEKKLVDKEDKKYEKDVRKKDDQQADDEKKHVDKKDKKFEKDVRKKDEQHADDEKKHGDKDASDSDDDDDDDEDEKDHKNEKKGEHDDDSDDDDDDEDQVDGDDSEKENIGTYELKKGNLTIKFTNWGASIMSLQFPDKNGKIGDIVLGYDSIKSYKVYFGATVGRVANRIGNAQFKLNGQEYKTSVNDGKNTLHGGKKGFGDVVWGVAQHKYDGKKPHIVFTYTSSDGDQGFPGELNVTVTYKILKENELSVVMEATPKDKATPVNLAHHSYWNLGGHDAGNILSEEIQILGSKYTAVDGELIPTGKISPVKGTPYDFLQLRPIKYNMKDLKSGYDINYCIDGKGEKMRKIVELVDKKSGRKMELSANQPGLQFYTGGMLKDIKGKNGMVYKAFAGLCLETQSYPNAVNYPDFPSQIVKPGKKYRHTMVFKFSIVS